MPFDRSGAHNRPLYDHRWRDKAVKASRKITRIALAFEAGRDGFWLARWLQAREVEAHVIPRSRRTGLGRRKKTGVLRRGRGYRPRRDHRASRLQSPPPNAAT